MRKNLLGVRVADMLLAIAMIIKKILKYAMVLLAACSTDYGINTEIIEIVDPSQPVVVDSLIQSTLPVSIDVLIVLDTSGSMSNNYEQVSRGVEILRGDIEGITYDYRVGFINSSLIDTYFSGPYDVYSSAIDFLLAPWVLS